MRLVTFSHQGFTRLGIDIAWHGKSYILDLAAVRPDLPREMVAFLQVGDASLATAKQAAADPQERWLIPAAEATLLAPVARPGKIVCLGFNYFGHLGEGRSDPPAFPTLFCKTVNTIIGPEQPVFLPRGSKDVDYEGELAVVIGKVCRHVSQAAALDCVAGYTIFNDVSDRTYQHRTSQWMAGKSFDTFGPMGPALVTSDEITDPGKLDIWLTLNDREMQRSNTSYMIFPIPFVVAYLSEIMTLEPGDLISTGTPAKTELAKTVPPFMKPSDRVSVHVEKIGELSNPIVAEA